MQSGRLCFQRVTMSDADELSRLLRRQAIYADVDGGETPSVEEFRRQVEQWVNGPGERQAGQVWDDFVVRLQSNGAMIGRVGSTWHDHRVEIAYFLGEAYWGQGYAQQSVRWLMAYCRQRLSVDSFWIVCTPRNHRSARLAVRLGFRLHDGINRPRLFSHDQGDDVYVRSAADEPAPPARA